MKHIVVAVFTLFFVGSIKAQEEFLRDKGGISIVTGHLQNDHVDLAVYGLTSTFKSGFVLGFAVREVYRGNPAGTVLLGYQSTPNEKRHFARGTFMGSFTPTADVTLFGLGGGISYIIHAPSHFPTSFNAGVKVDLAFGNNISNRIAPGFSVGINQALFQNWWVSPYVGAVITHAFKLNQSDTFYGINIGLNINFNGKSG